MCGRGLLGAIGPSIGCRRSVGNYCIRVKTILEGSCTEGQRRRREHPLEATTSRNERDGFQIGSDQVSCQHCKGAAT